MSKMTNAERFAKTEKSAALARQVCEQMEIEMPHDVLVARIGAHAYTSIIGAGYVLVPRKWFDEAARLIVRIKS